jgi:hypothetical protein
MTQVQDAALVVEANALSTSIRASDAQSSTVSAARPMGRAQAIIQGVAIAALLVLAGYETFLCFALEPNGLL